MALVDMLKKPSLAPPAPPVHNGAAGLRSVDLSGHVGFDSLPDQLVSKVQQMGFTFNLLCVGETGIGKSTMMESLFNMKLDLSPCSFELGTVELKANTYDVSEGNVKLKLTIVETAGFGDQLDKEKSGKVIVDYINSQFEAYLQEELKIKRHLATYKDSRIHACIYFISPTGHGLKALDVSVMKELSSKVNVIPIIAKADTISKDELKRFKVKIMSDLKSQGIETYAFPTDDETVSEINSKLNALMPFAVVGSTDFVKKNGKSVRARNYPWGIVEVENEEHCDFVQLREALLRTNVEDLRERTHLVLYENYRKHRLGEMGIKDGDVGPGMKASYNQKRADHLATLKQKEEESKRDFVIRVTAKEEELKEQERQIKAKADGQKTKYQTELTKLEEEERKLHEEMAEFERKKTQFVGTLNKKNKVK